MVVATSEGYYCNTEVGGLPKSPHFSRTNHLLEYLPRNSLIEVHKSEVSGLLVVRHVICVCVFVGQ